MLTATAREQSADAERRQQRLDERERLLVEEAERLAERDRRISAAEVDLSDRESGLTARELVLAELDEDRRRELERIAGLTAGAARQELIEAIETQAKREAALLVREIERLTLEKLILDGRIHPHRIEEVFDLAKHEVERLCLRAAEDALVEVGITDLHPELVTLLGRLRYRTSYGQNVLKHLVETAHIAGMMAAELRLDPALIKRCAFLHDIGKALTHEVEGSHALIGADLA